MHRDQGLENFESSDIILAYFGNLNFKDTVVKYITADTIELLPHLAYNRDSMFLTTHTKGTVKGLAKGKLTVAIRDTSTDDSESVVDITGQPSSHCVSDFQDVCDTTDHLESEISDIGTDAQDICAKTGEEDLHGAMEGETVDCAPDNQDFCGKTGEEDLHGAILTETVDCAPDNQDLSDKTDDEVMEGDNIDFAPDNQDLSDKEDQKDTNVESDEGNDHDTSHETIAYFMEDQNGDLVNENNSDIMNDDVTSIPFKKHKMYFGNQENSNVSVTSANNSPDGAVGTSAVSAPLAPSSDSDEHGNKSPEGASNAQEPAAGTSAVSRPLPHSSHSDEDGNN